jgi:hypothetical protein
MSHEYKQISPQGPQTSRVQEREPEEVVDEVQEAIAKGKEYSYKIKFPDKTKFSVPIWDTVT